MVEYEVTLGESIVHTITVRAHTGRQAIEHAKELIANLDDEVLKLSHGYRVDTVGWDGYEEAEEVR